LAEELTFASRDIFKNTAMPLTRYYALSGNGAQSDKTASCRQRNALSGGVVFCGDTVELSLQARGQTGLLPANFR
jgi:hypothetical protein